MFWPCLRLASSRMMSVGGSLQTSHAFKFGRDHRGTFTKLSVNGKLADGTPVSSFVEELVTVSQPGVIRGLHFQHAPALAKWVQCVSGRVWDVVVDLRHGQPSYGQWRGMELSFDGPLLHIPAGFAQGFCVLGTEPAALVYRFQQPYAPGGEGAIRWDDPRLKINWPVDQPVLSDRDLHAPTFAAYETSNLRRTRWWGGS